jgi:MOSC domain-containing protein YiiM
MDPVSHAHLAAGRGITGNADQGGRRQVTLLSNEHWAELTEHLQSPQRQNPTASVTTAVDPVARRANLLIGGIELRASLGKVGKVVRIGDVRIRILGETRPCERMDEACQGLRSALSVPWGGGAFGEVVDNGDIHVGDTVAWE